MLRAILGVDLCQVDGISEISAIELISETGMDMKKWKNCNHFSAWVNLAPNTKITGGRVISSKMQKKKNHAGQTLRMSASNLSRSKSPIGDYARKMKSRLGKKGGVVATAHKLARIIYTMIKEKKAYDAEIIKTEQKIWVNKRISYLEDQIKYLKKVA
jgi:transposase